MRQRWGNAIQKQYALGSKAAGGQAISMTCDQQVFGGCLGGRAGCDEVSHIELQAYQMMICRGDVLDNVKETM